MLTAIQHNLELMTQFDISAEPEQQGFSEAVREGGLRAGLAWRDARFKDL
jgi:hypothetical protein